MMNNLTEGTQDPGKGEHVVPVEGDDEDSLKADTTKEGF